MNRDDLRMGWAVRFFILGTLLYFGYQLSVERGRAAALQVLVDRLRDEIRQRDGAIRSEQSWFLLCHERYMECRERAERSAPPPSRDAAAP